MKTLFLAWQDPNSRAWFPIDLDVKGAMFRVLVYNLQNLMPLCQGNWQSPSQ
jgi:hypothetical protein